VYNTVVPIHKEYDKTFFKKWSLDMAYILGFLFADGNLVKTKRNTYFTAFYTSDFDLISSIRVKIKSNHKISSKISKTGVVYVLQIGSGELFDDLGKLGLTPNKSRRMNLPKIPKKYIGDFVRGYFDGDGNVWVGLLNKNRSKPTTVITCAFTSASRDFLLNISRLLKGRGLVGGSLVYIKSKNCSRLQYSIQDTLKLYRIMYNRQNKLYLERKKLVFDKYIEMRP